MGMDYCFYYVDMKKTKQVLESKSILELAKNTFSECYELSSSSMHRIELFTKEIFGNKNMKFSDISQEMWDKILKVWKKFDKIIPIDSTMNRVPIPTRVEMWNKFAEKLNTVPENKKLNEKKPTNFLKKWFDKASERSWEKYGARYPILNQDELLYMYENEDPKNEPEINTLLLLFDLLCVIDNNLQFIDEKKITKHKVRLYYNKCAIYNQGLDKLMTSLGFGNYFDSDPVINLKTNRQDGSRRILEYSISDKKTKSALFLDRINISSLNISEYIDLLSKLKSKQKLANFKKQLVKDTAFEDPEIQARIINGLEDMLELFKLAKKRDYLVLCKWG